MPGASRDGLVGMENRRQLPQKRKSPPALPHRRASTSTLWSYHSYTHRNHSRKRLASVVLFLKRTHFFSESPPQADFRRGAGAAGGQLVTAGAMRPVRLARVHPCLPHLRQALQRHAEAVTRPPPDEEGRARMWIQGGVLPQYSPAPGPAPGWVAPARCRASRCQRPWKRGPLPHPWKNYHGT